MKTFIIFLCTLLASTVYAVPAINESNDFFNSWIQPEDSNYTQGLELSSTRSYKQSPRILQKLASFLPEFSFNTCPVKANPDFIGVGILQDIFTPRERDATDLVKDDQPYSGFLAARLTRLNQDSNYRISTSLYAGMVGPWSFAEQAQNGFHEFIHNKKFLGWKNQLHNEPAFYMNYKRGFVDYKTGSYAGVMFLTDEEVNLGTVYTDLSLRKEIRFGYNLQGYNLDNKNLSVYVFMHPEVKGILRNIHLDGNTFQNSHHVDTEPFQAAIDSGLTIEYYGWQVSYHINYATKDFSEQKEAIHGFAGIRIEKLFSSFDI